MGEAAWESLGLGESSGGGKEGWLVPCLPPAGAFLGQRGGGSPVPAPAMEVQPSDSAGAFPRRLRHLLSSGKAGLMGLKKKSPDCRADCEV